MKKIILASSSPRRIEILKNLGLEFEISPPEITELPFPEESPRDFAVRCSKDKALEIAQKEKGLIIAADTIVVLNDRIIGKPKDKQDAFNILRDLSGKKHTVITGVTVIDTENNQYESDFEETDVWITELTDREISAYINSFEPTDKAGAYAAQGKGAMLVEKVSGDFFNVVGLPVFRLYKLLNKFNIDLLKS